MSTMIRTASLFGTAAGVLSCALFTGTECTTEARPGITVEVRDSISGAPVADVRVIARDGAFADTAEVPVTFALSTTSDEPLPPINVFHLVHERPSTYLVTAEKEGYQLWSRSGVQVRDGGCHVRTVSLVARLQR